MDAHATHVCAPLSACMHAAICAATHRWCPQPALPPQCSVGFAPWDDRLLVYSEESKHVHLRRVPRENEAAAGASSGGGSGDGAEVAGDQQGAAPPAAALFEQNARDGEPACSCNRVCGVLCFSAATGIVVVCRRTVLEGVLCCSACCRPGRCAAGLPAAAPAHPAAR